MLISLTLTLKSKMKTGYFGALQSPTRLHILYCSIFGARQLPIVVTYDWIASGNLLLLGVHAWIEQDSFYLPFASKVVIRCGV